ncbi:hypothetical protein UMM65_03430 [Aureibaculum sp. 2210JD6-5]|uniref:hypothetical protein n=1 Tax=Aureibaculum sp. 2210JD6-5 TaxID=3103957 RepID=UPI002AAEFF7E|nr:hypothetical protein [Aureibaculum sp. 2210JD6-5]MDY7394278.1 hypothetical protein [Aureibaculum sp. 2210JD6-5]
MENKIVLNALGNEEFSNIGALSNFYSEIRRQKEHSKIAFQKGNRQFTILSYYLNKKIKGMELQLTSLSNWPIKIVNKIYENDKDVFTTIYSNLVCLKKHHLN